MRQDDVGDQFARLPDFNGPCRWQDTYVRVVVTANQSELNRRVPRKKRFQRPARG